MLYFRAALLWNQKPKTREAQTTYHENANKPLPIKEAATRRLEQNKMFFSSKAL